MRRSSAPSKLGVKFNPPSIRPSSNSITAAVSAPVENAARTTESILGLIAKVKQNSDFAFDCASPEQSTEHLEPQSSSTVLSEQVTNKQTSEITINKRIFNVVYGKPSKKKHKTWEGDGILEVGEKSLILKDCEGNLLGRGSGKKNSELEEGSRIFVGNKEVEIIDAVSSPSEVIKRPREPASPERPKAKKTKVSVASRGCTLPRHVAPHHLQSFEPLTMPQPDLDHQWQFNKCGAPVNSVSVDPSLVRVLRPHQREGVVFLYRCVTGLRDPHHLGAILADEMGLGKTLQTITLIWTLLRQSLYGREPLLRKVLIVTPSSLVQNWFQEFHRWLGHHRIHVFVVDQKNKPRDFLNVPNVPVMIISYEMFVRCYDVVASVPFDLVVCDEGHRLKNSSVKASTLLSQLPCRRRILLSGTPIQNDLQEFYALVNFVNPNIFGTYEEFRETYEDSIVASRQPELPDEVKMKGEGRAMELALRAAGFVLRRTHAILDKYLPGKHEVVVFCKPSHVQLELFRAAIACWEASRCGEGRTVSHLAIITALKKISSHPMLLRETEGDKENDYLSEQLCAELSRLSGDQVMIEDASKLTVVTALLHAVSKSNEKIVLVSYFTQTLDLLQALCDQYGYQHCRLDGSTPSSRRVDIVNDFNSPHSSKSVFLLSARAGGVGLNLVGASRLVLFDPDWNPASDLQAMARVWRDGQRRTVHIYRLLTTGSIEEKIFQRQLKKAGLNEAVVDFTHTSAVRLSDEELKDLFTVEEEVDSLTHRMLECECAGEGNVPHPLVPQSETRQCQLLSHTLQHGQSLRSNQLFQWQHFRHPLPYDLLTEMGLEEAGHLITFLFRNVVDASTPHPTVDINVYHSTTAMKTAKC